MNRPLQAAFAAVAVAIGAVYHIWRAWTVAAVPGETVFTSSDFVLSTVYAGWYLLLLAGLLRLQAWARALFLYGTPTLFGIEVAVQLIEYDPLPADLLLAAGCWLILAIALASRRVAQNFD